MPRRTHSHATRPRPVPGGTINLDHLQAGEVSPTGFPFVPRPRPQVVVAARTGRGALWDVAPVTDEDLFSCLPAKVRTPRHLAFARLQDDRLLTALTSRERVAVLYARDHLAPHSHREDAAAYSEAARSLTPRDIAVIDRAIIDRRLPA